MNNKSIKDVFLLLREEIENSSELLKDDKAKFEECRNLIAREFNWTYGFFGEQFNCTDVDFSKEA